MNNKNRTEQIGESWSVEKYEENKIKNLIYCIRGKQVMLDSDVAMLYHYETKNINKAMKRNIERFPEDFCFRLTEEEIKNLRFQFGTSSLEEENYGGRRYLPYAYTEQGISMLSGILKNEIAIQVSISIMRTFIEMRKFISTNAQIFERLTSVEFKLLEHDNEINKVFNELQKKNKNVEVIIFTSQNCNITKLDIKKFNEQYSTLKIAKTNRFHDRFIIIDNKEMYHCGASLKDLGKKCFGINKIEEEKIITEIMKIII